MSKEVTNNEDQKREATSSRHHTLLTLNSLIKLEAHENEEAVQFPTNHQE